MEVSGKRMLTTFPMCEPCQTENLSKQSDGFCTHCTEYMCQTCFLHHLKAKACRNHVLDPFNIGSSDSGLQIQEVKCKKHIKETLKYYCLSHDSVVCGDCLVLDHPKCEPKFIKDVAENFEESSKFKDFLIKMPKWVADKAEGTMCVESNRKENKALLDNALQNLRKSREEINVWLDEMEKDIEIEARKISDDNELLLSEIEKNLEAVSDDIITIKEKMDTKLYHPETLFINMVECKPKMDAIEATLSDIKNKNEIRTYAFEPEIKVNETKFLRIGVIKVSSDENKEGAQNGSKGDLNLFAGDLIMRAMFDYDAVNDGDISFKRGDKLVILGKERNSDWWMARHLTGGQKGFIPGNYVTKDDTSIQSQEWWYNVDKHTAEKQLLLPGCPAGTFLLRESGDKTSLVLSVRNYDDQKTSDACVKHYRIEQHDNGDFYISPKRTFNNMLDLIFHYRHAADGLCCKLEIPCPKIRPLVQFRELEVPRESVTLLQKLGSGCFGEEVYAGKWRNKVDVAVKILKKGQMTAGDILAEAKLLHQLRHNAVVQLMAVCTKSEPIWIITELMINGPLLEHLRKDGGKLLKFPKLIDIAGQIADGMAYLETEKIVHRDLRAMNILVGEHNEVKVTNFGLARLIQGDIYNVENNAVFPLKWTAPEAAFGKKFSIKSDVWSYGVLLYELITFGKVPYPGLSGQDVLNSVEKGFRMQKPSGGPVSCPEPYYEIMLKCWNQVANSRPTFAYLRDFFNNYVGVS